MIPDHYATLGLTPHAEHSVIRAAYLALMLCYHPDRNQTAEAAERAREVTAAFEVLGNPKRRIDYDMDRADARARLTNQISGPPGQKRAAAALFATAVFGLFMLLYLVPFAQEIDRRIDRKAAVHSPQRATPKEPDPQSRCSLASNAELIKQELFARAVRLRGADQAVYRKLAAYSVIRLQSPQSVRTDADRRTVYCDASIRLDLPPGVAVPGGRRNVSANIGYSLKSADSGRDLLELFHAGTIARDLATLVSVRVGAEPSTSTEAVDARAPVEGARPPAPVVLEPPPPTRVEQPGGVQASRVPPRPPVARPRPAAEPRAVPQLPRKASPALAGLDRALREVFSQSMQRADAAKRRTLYRDHNRFIARLNRCSSEACSRAEYLARMREISNTMVAPAPDG